jgi:hypothetical protein
MTVATGSIGRGKRQVRLRGATGWITADHRYLLLHVWRDTWEACWDPTVPGRWIAYEHQVPWEVIAGEQWRRLPGDWRTLGEVTAALEAGIDARPVPRARPESLRRVEDAITRALVGADFGQQWLTIRDNGFEITVDGLLIRVESAGGS